MIGDDLRALVRRHHRDPALFGFVQAVDEVVQTLFEISTIVRLGSSQSVEDFSRDDLSVLRIQPIVWIARADGHRLPPV